MNADSLSELKARYQQILQRIPAKTRLIAVSKMQSIDAIEALYRLGHRDFGENYAQELSVKANELHRRGCLEIKWHFIGHLQTNKAKIVVPLASCIHTVDSEKLALELTKKLKALQASNAILSKEIPVFIEVNIDKEPAKSGIIPEEAPHFAEILHKIEGIRLEGLMCIPATGKDPRSSFRRLRELELSCRPLSLGGLSMGMSDDYETAIEEGATHVRIGTALFGTR